MLNFAGLVKNGQNSETISKNILKYEIDEIDKMDKMDKIDKLDKTDKIDKRVKWTKLATVMY